MDQQIIDSLSIIIATVGRKTMAEQTIASLASRRTVPNCVIVVGADHQDLPDCGKTLPFPVTLLVAGKRSLPFQRNYGIRYLPRSIDSVAFLDDDMEIHDDYCAEVENVFKSTPGVAGFSGSVLANGKISREKARAELDHYRIHPNMPVFGFYPNKWPGFYGCAMNVRRCMLDLEQFDEKLPLYALGEDCELGFRLSRHGSVGGSGRCPAVHLAAKSGRISEVGFGYAQIINYIYFARKGIGYPTMETYWQRLIRTPLTNLVCCLWKRLDNKDEVDRNGRLYGNVLAIYDIARGRVDPANLVKVVSSA